MHHFLIVTLFSATKAPVSIFFPSSGPLPANNYLLELYKHLEELTKYVENNRHIIHNDGEKWRDGETITTSFVESTVNEVVTKRIVKKQQMQSSHVGAHYLLKARTSVLNNDLPDYF
tara:strand:+ start:1552 stop:1902 length:351 start_codon:yes stop_codon:yes gene_type:complete